MFPFTFVNNPNLAVLNPVETEQAFLFYLIEDFFYFYRLGAPALTFQYFSKNYFENCFFKPFLLVFLLEHP